MVVEQANREEDEDSSSLDREQSEVIPYEEIEEDPEEVAQYSKEEQKETLPGTWGSKLRPWKASNLRRGDVAHLISRNYVM